MYKRQNRGFWSIVLLLSTVSALALLPFGLLAENTPDTAALERADEMLFKRLKAQSGADDGSIYQALGFSYFKQGIFDRSMLYFNRAIASNPRLYWSWYYMGLLNMENPERYFNKAIEANPRFAPPHYWLARYYCKNKRIKESVRSFEEYVRIAHNDPQEAGRVDIAKRFLELIKAGETDYETLIKKVPGA